MQCFVHEEGLAKIAGVGDVRGGSIFVEGRVAVIGRAKCGALLGSAGEGIPGARISRLALQEGGLCLRVGGSGALKGGVARSLAGGRVFGAQGGLGLASAAALAVELAAAFSLAACATAGSTVVAASAMAQCS